MYVLCPAVNQCQRVNGWTQWSSIIEIHSVQTRRTAHNEQGLFYLYLLAISLSSVYSYTFFECNYTIRKALPASSLIVIQNGKNPRTPSEADGPRLRREPVSVHLQQDWPLQHHGTAVREGHRRVKVGRWMKVKIVLRSNNAKSCHNS